MGMDGMIWSESEYNFVVELRKQVIPKVHVWYALALDIENGEEREDCA